MGKGALILIAAVGLAAALLLPGMHRGPANSGSAPAATGSTPAATAEAPEVLGDEIDFTLQDPDGRPVRLSDLKGNVVVLSFWATWCPPCREEIPHLDAMNKRYQGKPVRILGANVDRQGADLKQWLAEQKLSFPVVADVGGKVSEQYGVSGIPTLLVIDKEGKIRHRTEGFDPQIEETVGKLVDELSK